MRQIPLIVALVVAIAGIGYALTHPPDYESTARLALVPASEDPAVNADLLSSVTSAGTVGTYVELFSSEDITSATADSSTDISVRSVPGSRIIEVTATGDEDQVRRDLLLVLAAGEAKVSSLSDFWKTVVVQRPSAPEQQRPGTALMLLAALVLAVLSGLFAHALMRRTSLPSRHERAAASPPAQP